MFSTPVLLLLFLISPAGATCSCIGNSVQTDSCFSGFSPVCGVGNACLCAQDNASGGGNAGTCQCLSGGTILSNTCATGKVPVCGVAGCSCLDKEECGCSSRGLVQSDSCDSRGAAKEGVCTGSSNACVCVKKESSLRDNECDCVGSKVYVENCRANKEAKCIAGTCSCVTKLEAPPGTCACVNNMPEINSCEGGSSPTCKKGGVCKCSSSNGERPMMSLAFWAGLSTSGFLLSVVLVG